MHLNVIECRNDPVRVHFCTQACQGDIYKTVVYERYGI